ncbi:MAG: (Fe-S)-binding protein [Dehalococcoidales bacterium]|nr:(Fe-S)-binding protein [Dehalococcoidales bacterium]
MSPLSMTYLGIPGYAIFWVLTVAASGLFFYRISRLIRYMFLGQKEKGFSHLLRRALKMTAITLGQWCQLKGITLKDRAGIGHATLAWGFFVFVVFYVVFIIIGAGFGLSETLEHSAFFFYYTWVMDIIAPIVVLVILWAIVRRYIVRPPRLQGEQTGEALVILITVLLPPVTHLFKIATVIALGNPPAGLGGALPAISSALSNIFAGMSTGSVETALAIFFWANWLVILFLLVSIPHSRHFHMVASLFNIFFRSPLPKGALRTIDLEAVETFGAAKITDLSWKQVLDLYSCVVCGQCQDACPATASGKPLNPKKLIQDLKIHLLEAGPELLKHRGGSDNPGDKPAKTLPGEVITRDEIWACTTCRACDEICPLYVEHIDKIIDLRRNLVLEQASLPETAEQALRSLETRGHPWRGTTASRTDWAQGLDIRTLAEDGQVDFLFWVGCTGALEERSTKISRSLARILKLAGVNFGILGVEESCCGEPARRLGNEYLFQVQAESNIQILQGHGVKKMVTACPHCYNTFKNEYPEFGGKFEVWHHTELIALLLKEGRLKTNQGTGGLITYHDPCYLGRYNDIYQPPRQLIKSLPATRLVETANNKKRGFCCGGGGGRMWMEEESGQRVSKLRLEQALMTGAKTIATACPFCLQMLDDAAKAGNGNTGPVVMDIAELAARAADAGQD